MSTGTRAWKFLCVVASALCLGGAAHAENGKPIVIGLVMPYSGWFQPIDDATIKGALLAIDDINAKGGVLGRKLEVVEFDNKSEPPRGADGAIEVISKGATAILFPSDFDFGAPGAFIAQQKGVLAFSGASDPKFGVQGIGSMAYSMSMASQAQGALLAEWAYKSKGLRTAYVLLDNTISYTKSLCANFATRWKELAGADGLLGEDTFLNKDPTITPQTTRILALAKKPDLIFLCTYAPGGPSAIRQLRAAGITQPILTGESMDGDYWTGTVPDLSNFYVANYGALNGDDPDATINAFYERYKTKFGKRADVSYALRGYSAIEAYAKAVTRAGSTEGAKVAAELDKFKAEPLAIGPTTYSSDLHIQLKRPMTIVEAQAGKFKAVTRYAPEQVPPITY